MPNAVVPSTHHLADFFVKFPAALGSILSGRQSQDEDEEEADQQQQQPPQQQTASLNLTTRDCEDDDARDKEGRDSGEKKQSDSSGSSTWDDNSKIAKADRPDLKAGDKIQYYQFGNQGIPRFLTETEVIAVDPANEYQPLTLRCGTVLRTILSGNIRRSNPPDRCWRPIRAYNLIESQTMTLGDCMREQASSFRATLGNNMKRVQGNGKAAGFAPMDVLQDMARTRNSSTGESSSSTGE
jgi:hypothetical protein